MPEFISSSAIRLLVCAARLKAFRISRGFSTARKFATALGIDENRYTRYERAEVEPDLSLAVADAGVLKATPNDLLEHDRDDRRILRSSASGLL